MILNIIAISPCIALILMVLPLSWNILRRDALGAVPFKNGVELDEGDYSLVTGTRLANGGVLAEMQMFHVEKGGTTVIDMHLRTSSTEVTVIGNFDSESKFMLLTSPEANGICPLHLLQLMPRR